MDGVSVGESGTVSECPGRLVIVSECPGRLVIVSECPGRVVIDSSGPGAVKAAEVQARMEASARNLYILLGMVLGTVASCWKRNECWCLVIVVSSDWNNERGLLEGGCNCRSPSLNI